MVKIGRQLSPSKFLSADTIDPNVATASTFHVSNYTFYGGRKTANLNKILTLNIPINDVEMIQTDEEFIYSIQLPADDIKNISFDRLNEVIYNNRLELVNVFKRYSDPSEFIDEYVEESDIFSKAHPNTIFINSDSSELSSRNVISGILGVSKLVSDLHTIKPTIELYNINIKTMAATASPTTKNGFDPNLEFDSDDSDI